MFFFEHCSQSLPALRVFRAETMLTVYCALYIRVILRLYGSACSGIFAKFLLILQILENNSMKKIPNKIFVFISILFSQSMGFKSSISVMSLSCIKILCWWSCWRWQFWFFQILSNWQRNSLNTVKLKFLEHIPVMNIHWTIITFTLCSTHQIFKIWLSVL